MSTQTPVVPKLLFSSVPLGAGGTAKDPVVEADETELKSAAPTLSSTHLRKLAVSVPAMVGDAIRSQLPFSS